MNKILLGLICAIFCTTNMTAQLYSDDFESYEEGSYIGKQSDYFTTWSGNTGTGEDAKIVTTKAKSGTKSLYFYSDNSGEQDVLLTFGKQHTSGVLTLRFSIFVPDGKYAYWNIQEQTTPGQVWSGNAFMYNDGFLTLDALGADNKLFIPIELDKWNDIEYIFDLDNKQWQVKLNNTCVGTFLTDADVASLDLFPSKTNGLVSEFWVDDVYLSLDDSNGPTTDVVITTIESNGLLELNEQADLKVNLFNAGSDKINNLDVIIKDENDNLLKKESFSDLAMESGSNQSVVIKEVFIAKEGNNLIFVDLENINGLASDDVPCNNQHYTGLKALNITEGKVVIIEELTGTWCGYCPRGAVMLDRTIKKYGDRVAAIAVHAGSGSAVDPMEVTAYKNDLTGFPGFSGFPNAIVDRKNLSDPAAMEPNIINQLQAPINATFDIKASFDESSRELTATINLTALEDIKANRKLYLVITEDGVTGTGPGWAQVNYYAGGGSGKMGGYENLPNPVPASQMVYDHVARAILPSEKGGKLEEDIVQGDSKTFTVGVELDESINVDSLKLIAFLTKASPAREITSAFSIDIAKALSNGVGVEFNEPKEMALSIAPNPAKHSTAVRVDIEGSQSVSISLLAPTGNLITKRDYGVLTGNQVFDLSVMNLASGIYHVVVQVGQKYTTKKIVVIN